MDAVLTINNDFTYLITPDQGLKSKLYNLLRFRQKNYYHSRAYKSGKWDGFINFFNETSGKFLTGLLPEVQVSLEHFNIQYEIVDKRTPFSFTHTSIDKDFLKPWTPKGADQLDLYDYQVDLVNQALKYKGGVIKAPTGSGKTQIMICILKCLPKNTPVLFLASSMDLISQNYEEMIKWGIQNVGRFNSDYHDPNIITCANVQSLHHLENLLPKFKAVIADEIHLLSNKSGVAAFKKLKGAPVRIAVSATPFKFGEKDKVQKYTVKGFFGPIFKTQATESGVLTTSFLQERGTLSKSKCIFFVRKEPKLPYHVWVDAVDEGIAKNFELNKFIASLAKGLKGRTLILVDRIVQGDWLSHLIPGSLWVRGEDNEKTRKFVREELKNSKKDVIAIATRKIFDTGINLFIHSLIDSTDVSAEHSVVQLMGRGLRTASDKDILTYYSFYHKNNPHLEKHSKEKVKILKKEGHEVVIQED